MTVREFQLEASITFDIPKSSAPVHSPKHTMSNPTKRPSARYRMSPLLRECRGYRSPSQRRLTLSGSRCRRSRSISWPTTSCADSRQELVNCEASSERHPDLHECHCRASRLATPFLPSLLCQDYDFAALGIRDHHRVHWLDASSCRKVDLFACFHHAHLASQRVARPSQDVQRLRRGYPESSRSCSLVKSSKRQCWCDGRQCKGWSGYRRPPWNDHSRLLNNANYNHFIVRPEICCEPEACDDRPRSTVKQMEMPNGFDILS